jgi:hypothetical protein
MTAKPIATTKPHTPIQAFILAQPHDMTANAVVDAAKKTGLKFSQATVYEVRAKHRAEPAASPQKRPRGRPPGARNKRRSRAGKVATAAPIHGHAIVPAKRAIPSVVAELDLLVTAGVINPIDAWERLARLRGDGGPDKTMISVSLTEEDRLLVLLALATFSHESPGFDVALNRVALSIDEPVKGRGRLYESFRELQAARLPAALAAAGSPRATQRPARGEVGGQVLGENGGS